MIKRLHISELMQQSGVAFGTSGVRGLVTSMTPELCIAYALSFAKTLSLKVNSTVVLGIDLRPSSMDIAAACYTALNSIGVNVEFCGDLPTPALALYAQNKNVPAIMVTGSHIPFDRNGIKFYSSKGEITKQEEASITAGEVQFDSNMSLIDLPKVNMGARELYVDRYVNFLPANYFADMTVAFYEHSSVARDILTDILKQLGANVISLGRTNEFTPIDTEAVAQVDVDRANTWATSHDFNAIISTDGDADRPLIGDENGNWLRGDIVGLLTAAYLEANAVATPVSCNTAIEKSEMFGTVLRTRIGSPYVIEAMAQLSNDAQNKVVGFEANGGFLLASTITKLAAALSPLCTRDAVLPIIAIMALSKERGVNVSQLSASLPPRTTASHRIKNFATEKSKALLAYLASEPTKINELLNDLAGSYRSVDTTDGLRITFLNDDIIHYRPSGNAPELRCYAESSTQVRAEQLVEEALTLIQTFEPT